MSGIGDYGEPDEDLNRLSKAVIGAAIEVHKYLGPGYAENVYGDALAIELEIRQIPFGREVGVAVQYKGHKVGEGKIDFLVCNLIVVELKVVEAILPVHQAQVISYLKATGLNLGLILNFNEEVLRTGIKRVIRRR